MTGIFRGFVAAASLKPKRKKLAPVHPGEVLREDFLVPMQLSAYAVARACGVPRTRIERLVREETPITADTALRLARYFGTTAAFWMGMQAQHDLERTEDEVAAELRLIEPSKPPDRHYP
jgi:antitoxin HigA-1